MSDKDDDLTEQQNLVRTVGIVTMIVTVVIAIGYALDPAFPSLESVWRYTISSVIAALTAIIVLRVGMFFSGRHHKAVMRELKKLDDIKKTFVKTVEPKEVNKLDQIESLLKEIRDLLKKSNGL